MLILNWLTRDEDVRLTARMPYHLQDRVSDPRGDPITLDAASHS